MTQTRSAKHEAIRSRALEQWSTLPERIGRYLVRGELGRGGMGIVYDGYDPQLDRPVAIKVVSPSIAGELAPEYASRLEHEMHATSRILDPHVVSVLDGGVWEVNGVALPYFVMERVDGPSLEELLQERGTLRRKEGLRLATGIARGLVAVHRSGLVHRDLKPSNVLIAVGGVPKITDFGLCSLRHELPDARTSVLGSAHYLAPEQIRGGEVGPPADVFALGSILIRLFSGLEAFPAPTVAEHMARVLHDEPEGLRLLDPDIGSLVERLMSKRPEHRPDAATAVDQLEALEAVGEPLDRGSDATQHGGSQSPPPRRVRLVQWLAGAVLGLATLAASAYGLSLRNELVLLDTEIDTQRKQVENQLTRRDELIPELDALLTRHLAHEREGLKLTRASPVATGEAPGSGWDARFALLLALVDRDPGSPTSRQFLALSHEISGTLNRIALERRRYNETVGHFNGRLRQPPWSWVSGALAPRDYLEPGRTLPDGA
jgi:serine/threonine protein kinase